MTTRVHTPASVFPRTEDVPEAMRVPYYDAGARHLIRGEVRDWSGPCQEVLSPICIAGESGASPHRVGRYPRMTGAEALDALEAACAAYGRGAGAWPTMSVADRIGHLQGFIPRMKEVRDECIRLLVWEIGKTVPDATKEFDRTVEYIQDTIEAMKDLDRTSARFAIEQGFIAQIRRSPLGVVLCMGPYNYPLNETFTTLIPALIMGNTVIFKPPRYGVLLHAPLLSAFAACFPPGVVNTVYGEGSVVVGPLIQSGRIDVLAFIGSARVASLLKHQHPQPNRLRCILGLEAKNAAVILPDADLDLAVKECLLGAFSYNGQRCTAIKIVFVHRTLAEAFCARFSAAVEDLTVGMPWEEGVRITPLPDEEKPRWLRGLVDEAVAGGARILNRGGASIDRTLFYPAALFPAPLESAVCGVEQFGPVTPIVPYGEPEEVVRWIADSPFGQQAALFGEDPAGLARLIDPLANLVCRININSQCQRGPDKFPFAGRKDSAEGTLSVTDALRVFSIRSLVAAKSTHLNRRIVSGIVTGRHSTFLSTDYIF
ncbi:MAG: NADP-dependent glyceraldehyde-3-phosphate dehydrogenase [Planctomycetes bacterium]|nr:NADP-dependent glyceraldehyde-3-phosphate dehydrogenase [Planctomycetota bacterium]